MSESFMRTRLRLLYEKWLPRKRMRASKSSKRDQGWRRAVNLL